MKQLLDTRSAKPFFLKAGFGNRFCIYHPPCDTRECRGVFIYVHPFGDEMNKSRRMAALQARAFTFMGFGVLQIDLFGCGDSAGEFGDARWDIWMDDLAHAKKWIEEHVPASISLWGLRLGALLALDFARKSDSRLETIILWQPIVVGETFLTQFLRMRLANDMLSGRNGDGANTQEMRRILATGKALEVAGYEIAPQLASAIDEVRMENLAITTCPVHWIEVVPEPGRPISSASLRVANEWTKSSVNLHMQTVACPPFWATQEISECPALLSASAEAVATVPQP